MRLLCLYIVVSRSRISLHPMPLNRFFCSQHPHLNVSVLPRRGVQSVPEISHTIFEGGPHRSGFIQSLLRVSLTYIT